MSFQFVVDALPADWEVFAPDWRGFGGSYTPHGRGADSYWFVDYLGDLDCLVEHLSPGQPLNLVGHSMGGNVATLYAGVRPQRVRRLVNLEGLGLRETQASQAPARLSQWLDQLRTPQRFADYADLEAVAARLRHNNPRLSRDKANFIAPHWAAPNGRGRYCLRADPQHKQINPYLYRLDETLACWGNISASVLWVLSEHISEWHSFAKSPEYQQRLSVIKNLRHDRVQGAGHMMHHDQPETVAQIIHSFMS